MPTEVSKTKSRPRTERSIRHELNNIVVEQRVTDGFINGTAMCVAHQKRINDWFYNKETIGLIEALANDLGFEVNYQNSGNSSVASISAAYPQLVVVKRGSPANGGGVWLHPDLAIQLAQWCNPFFAIQVSRWVREWVIAAEEHRRRQKVIAACVSDTASPWEIRFVDDFMQELQRVSGRNRAAAALLLTHFYKQLSTDVYSRLKEVNPMINGRR